MTSRLWYYRYPGGFYAIGPMRFDRPVTERQARTHLRDLEGVPRLLRGTEVWPTSEQQIAAVGRSHR